LSERILVIGATGGIGSAVCNKLAKENYSVTAWSSKELDLNYPETIFEKDFSAYTTIINCAGHNQGTYQGFLHNSSQNQISQVNVNYISNLFLCKHFANSVSKGKYIWCNSTSTDNPRPFHSVYAGTKAASEFSLNLIAQEADHISIVNVKIGLVRSNFRYRNFCGTKTKEEVEKTYDDYPQNIISLDAVANTILYAVQNQISEITIK
jgi:short-subunit dehydrogenase